MIVTGYTAAGHISITNNEFDGKTSWSASCNAKHYWTMLFLGSADYITMAGNYFHNVSGRAPKVGGSGAVTMHAVNNLFSNIGGHAFHVCTGASVWIEGNVFENVKTPILSQPSIPSGSLYNVAGAACQTSAVGRSCVANSVSSSGAFPASGTTKMLDRFSGATVFKAAPVSGVKASVLANAGIGKLSSMRKRGRASRLNY